MEGAKRHDRRLGAFIADVEANRVSKGSVLLVESLDRLTRQQIGDALELFLKLLRLGITIIAPPLSRFSTEQASTMCRPCSLSSSSLSEPTKSLS